MLTEEEKERSARYRFIRDRRAYELGRFIVRTTLKATIPLEPFAIRDRGKPYINGYPAFNISHSGGLVAVAFARREPLGVDIELIRSDNQSTDLIAAVCHPAERRALARCFEQERNEMFYRCWTRKEAVLKATGEGLRDDLRSLDVKLSQHQPTITSEALSMALFDVPLRWKGYSCTLAVDPGVTVIDVLSPFHSYQLACIEQVHDTEHVI
ncbi:4'-phosphopantetheinyl transferase [Pseudovibrio denitrificans]|uniref:4'-phosphopantetheinyl transferase n=1 Tax=Pseudovibrio denitrificans TaxID=258256 RepID=A0A1I7D1G4_9HYPH|nr:4'-phosphopantetheinyl transferase superfamily protein [Pseudovibrio denitrificans]SFU05509.1 4'-phosphopantetheinyl transferase [Pseudovibrio denitrificans]